MAQPPKRRFGDGATCSVLLKYLRPSKEVKERFPNLTVNQRLDDLVAVRQDIISRGRRTYPAVYFISPTFPGLQLHAARNKTTVLQEGDPGAFWDDVVSVPPPLAGEIAVPCDQQEAETDPNVFFTQNNGEVIARVCAEGFAVDDDNEPAPESHHICDRDGQR